MEATFYNQEGYAVWTWTVNGDGVGRMNTVGSEPESSRGGVQSISRAFEVLEVLAEHGPLGLSRLSARTGLPLTTVHRLIGTLTALGYVRSGEAEGSTPWRLG